MPQIESRMNIREKIAYRLVAIFASFLIMCVGFIAYLKNSRLGEIAADQEARYQERVCAGAQQTFCNNPITYSIECHGPDVSGIAPNEADCAAIDSVISRDPRFRPSEPKQVDSEPPAVNFIFIWRPLSGKHDLTCDFDIVASSERYTLPYSRVRSSCAPGQPDRPTVETRFFLSQFRILQ